MSSGKHDDVNNSRNRLCSCFILQRRLMARNCTRPSVTFCRQCSCEVRHQLGACMHDLLICAINRLLLTTVQLFVDLTQTSCWEVVRTVNGYFYTFPKLHKNMYRQTGGTHPNCSPPGIVGWIISAVYSGKTRERGGGKGVFPGKSWLPVRKCFPHSLHHFLFPAAFEINIAKGQERASFSTFW